jgi:hypothetical protein
MPKEDGSGSPSGNPKDETLGPSPRTNLPKQRVVSNDSEADPNYEEEGSEKPTGRIHWINHATFYLSIILAVLTAGTLRVYWLQLQQMIEVTRATQDSAYDACMSAKIARQTLLDFQTGEQDSHNSASSSMAQASAAARGQAGLLTLNLGKTMLPTSVPADNDTKKWTSLDMTFFFSNIGRSSIKNLHIDFTVQILPQGTEPNIAGRKPHLNKTRSGIIQPGEAFAVGTIIIDSNGKVLKQDDIPMEDFRSGRIWLVDFGRAEYQDIFGISHWQTFCGRIDNFSLDTEHPEMQHPKCLDYNRQDSNLLFSVSSPASFSPAAPIEEIKCIVPKP